MGEHLRQKFKVIWSLGASDGTIYLLNPQIPVEAPGTPPLLLGSQCVTAPGACSILRRPSYIQEEGLWGLCQFSLATVILCSKQNQNLDGKQ